MGSHVFIAITGRGLARASQTSGGEWAVDFLLAEQDVRCLATDPRQPQTVYAGTQGNGVYCSDDAGKTWKPAGLSGQIVKALAVSPVEPGTVYAGTKPAYLFVSHDGGNQWAEVESFRHVRGRWFWKSPAETPFTAYVQAIGLSPTDPRAIVVGIEAGAVLHSDDGGQNWSNHRKGALRDCHSLMFHARDGSYVYEAGGTGAGVAMSRDGGYTWDQPKDGIDRHYGWACAADPAQPDIWYASIAPMPALFPPGPPPAHIDGKANAFIFRYRDGTWQKLGGGLPQPLTYMAYALITDPHAPGHLYAGLSNGDVWHSTNYGDSWAKLPFNLKGIYRSMILCSDDN